MINLIDVDIEALNYVNDELKKTIQENDLSKKLKRHVNYFPADLIKYLKSESLPVTEQDLIYAIGIADYLDDNVLIALMNLIYKSLSPGGTAIIGNFCDNSCDAMMRYVVDWKLNLRTEDDLLRLASKSLLSSSDLSIFYESEKINVFLKVKVQ